MPTPFTQKVKNASFIYFYDALWSIKFRGDNPFRFGLMWCAPKSINSSTRYFASKENGYLYSNSELSKNSVYNELSRFIADGEWDTDTTLIEDVKHISRTIRRYEKNLSWEEVGEIDWMMQNIKKFGVQDNCRSYADVITRCNNFDRLKQHLKKEGKLSTQRELNPGNFRELGGIGVAVDRNGDVMWFDNGAHRLAIARHLQLPEVPVCLQLIHPGAIKKGKLFKHLSSNPRFR